MRNYIIISLVLHIAIFSSVNSQRNWNRIYNNARFTRPQFSMPIFNNPIFGQPPPAPPLFNNAQPVIPQSPPPGPESIRYTHREVLDDSVDYILEWVFNRDNNVIGFNISARTNGYLIFALSKNGQVEGSDAVVVGQSSLMDMYGTANNTLLQDTRQDWELISSLSSGGRLMVTVLRRFDTCDDQDIEINNDMVHVIWGYGEGNFTTGSSFNPSGSKRLYLVDPPIPSASAGGLQTWRVSRTYRIPPRHTSYWCSIHKGNTLRSKHHIVGFSAYLGNDVARNHIHHQLVYRCFAPPGIDPALIFDKYTTHQGEECYLESDHELPTMFCTEIINIWGVGGNEFRFPDQLGIPLGETPNEYFMLETHYDNPESRSDLVAVNGVDFLYTSQLRQTEGSIIFVGSSPLGLYMVPPQSTEFNMMGMCNSECTREIIPSGGMEIVATMLHSHMTTHKIRFRRFRGNNEVSWIINDDNYDYSFQQVRLLPAPVTVLPGDQLLTECTMTTTSRNRTTLSGFSTMDEMCVTFFIVNKRIPYLYCSSEYPTQRTMERYGITNMTWDRNSQERVINSASDPDYVGRSLSEVIDNNVDWTPERRRELEREQLYGTHQVFCPAVRRLGMLAYAGLFVERITGGLINVSDRFDDSRPTTRAVSTPLPNWNATFPATSSVYAPTDSCR